MTKSRIIAALMIAVWGVGVAYVAVTDHETPEQERQALAWERGTP